jgi:hypothetical protein
MTASRFGFISTVVALLAAQPLLAVPAHAAAPTGCTTSVQWVQEGSNYYYGRGNVQCTSGRYTVKLQCRNQQTGVGYVVYGGTAVNAPATATTTCYTGNTVDGVFAVEDPRPVGVLSGCTPWAEWISSGSNYYYGQGRVQCDSGRYKVYIQCRNLQTGQGYVVSGATAVDAPATASTTCYLGNQAESVFAVADPRPSGISGCATWREWVNQSGNYYFGRGSVQCASGRYKARLSCRNLQSGATYTTDSAVIDAPYTATTTCYIGNVVDAVQAIAQ